MAYRADIEIAVKGARQLKELQDQIKVTGIKISVLNDNLNASGKLLTKSFNSVKTVVAEAAKNFDEAALGTDKAVTAAREYYQASKVLNNALRERAKLLDDIERAERGVILANIRASQAARKASGFGAFSADIDVPTQKAIRRNKEKRERIQAAAETAAQIDKLNTTQEEFITRTNAAAQAAARQTAEFYRQARAAKAVAKINAVAGPAQLLLPAATPGSPAMSGGARRRITGQVERLGGARTEDEAAIALRLAENIKQQVRPLSQVEALYAGIATEAAKLQSIKALPSSQMLNAAARGLQQIKTGQDKYNAELAESQERLEVLNRLEETRARRAKKLRDIATYYETGGISDPISGTGSTGIRVPGSVGNKTPKTGSALGTRAENVLIGGAFPLLFGGGPGAVLGGAAGGLIPGSPMLSVVTSALGAAVDQFAQATAEVGNALRDPIKNFATLADKGLLASKSQEKYIQKLIEAGRITEATAIIQDEIIKKIGVQGVKDLQNAGAASEELNRAMSELGLQMQAAVAGPLAAFISWLADVVSISNQIGREAARQTDIFAGLSAEDQAEVKRQEKRILSGMTIFNEAQKREDVSRLYKQYEPRATIKVPGATTDQTPALRAAAQTEELQKQVELAGKQLTLVGLTLEKDGARYIAAAKAVAQQEYDNRLIEIKNSWIGKIFDKEKNLAMIRKANLDLAIKNKQLDSEILQNTEMREKAALAAESALYKQVETTLMFAVRAAEFSEGEEASLLKHLSLHEAIGNQRKAALEVERELALSEAAKNGTTQEVLKLYEFKRLLLQDELNLEEAITQTKRDRILLDKATAQANALREAASPFVELQRDRELEQQYAKTYLRLVTEGMLPAEAERIANFDKLVAQQLAYKDEQIEVIEQQILLTESSITEAEARGVAVDKLKEQLDLLKQQRGIIEGKGKNGPGEGQTDVERVEGAIAKLKGELNELTNPINFAIRGAFAIGDAFQQAFQGLVTGAMTAQEALSAFFKSIGEAFVAMAAEIIAKQLVMIALQTILRALGGATGSGGGTETNTQFMERTGNLDLVGDSYKGLQGFATGGFVTSPTSAVVGEGGEPEYIIPASKMRGAMNRYAAGARGSSVIPGSGEQAAGEMGGGTAVATPIDVRYTVERINSVDYVTADQFQRGMRTAAEQGALRGEQRTLANIRQNTTTRRRLGL